MNRLKHKIKLLWLRRKWVVQCVYNTKDFRKARDFLELEKELTDEFHKKKREGNAVEIARAEGGLEVIESIKEVLE